MTKHVRWVQIFIAVGMLLYLWGASSQSAFAASSKATSVRFAQAQTCPQLPTNFDPMISSASMLASFHLPPRPTDSTQLTHWANELKHIKHLYCDNSFVSTKEILDHPSRTGEGADPFGQHIWSGYIDKNDTFFDVKGAWNTQCLGSNQAANAQEVSWVGIGGVNGTGNLWQAGTIYTSSDGLYHPFWEAAPANTLQINFNVNAGCGVSVSSEAFFNNGWCYMVDVDGFVSSGCPSIGQNFTADQSTAEWIDERPSCNGHPNHLTDFQFTSWSNSFAESVNIGWHTIEGYLFDQAFMTDVNNGNTLAQPDNLSSATTFTDRWKNRDTDGSNPC